MASPKGLTSSPLSPSLNRFSNWGGRGEGRLLLWSLLKVLCTDHGLQHPLCKGPALHAAPGMVHVWGGKTSVSWEKVGARGRERSMEQDKATDPFYHTGQGRLCNRKCPVLLRTTNTYQGALLIRCCKMSSNGTGGLPRRSRWAFCNCQTVTCVDLLAFSKSYTGLEPLATGTEEWKFTYMWRHPILVLSLVRGIVKSGATQKVYCMFTEQVALLLPPCIFTAPVGLIFPLELCTPQRPDAAKGLVLNDIYSIAGDRFKQFQSHSAVSLKYKIPNDNAVTRKHRHSNSQPQQQ